MIFYLTYNDLPSGIFSSQVIDVVKFLNSELNTKTKLISFISLRSFLKNRSKIKNEYAEAIVLPMFPGVHRWRLNIILLSIISFLYKPSAIIGRSVLATQLTLLLKKKNRIKNVIYDGRGAITAEWKEYQVITDELMLSEILNLEKEVVINSDYRIAVSEQLVNYWKKEFNYSDDKHVVIPCTLNSVFEDVIISDEQIEKSRSLLNLSKTDIAFVYSGSVSGWQSFNLLYDFMKPLLLANKNIKLFFLTQKDDNIRKIENEFRGRVFCFHVAPDEVPKYLLGADFGLLIRENTITNKVASPVKFAEYLACGLTVIISNELGDYSDFVLKHKCGYLFDNFLLKTENKKTINNLAIDHFTKKVSSLSYKKIINFIDF